MSPASRPVSDPRATPRRYESPLRARRLEETRASLVRSATELFTTRGWTGTGMREVASRADVAVETLYKHFSSKRKLFDAVVDHAVTGDDEPVAIAARPEFTALGEGARAERIDAAASLITAINSRTIGLARVLREAAATDEDIAEALRLTRERQRTDVATGLALILGRRPTDIERDEVWAMVSPEVYLLLVDGSGWDLDRYQRWVSHMLDRLLPQE